MLKVSAMFTEHQVKEITTWKLLSPISVNSTTCVWVGNYLCARFCPSLWGGSCAWSRYRNRFRIRSQDVLDPFLNFKCVVPTRNAGLAGNLDQVRASSLITWHHPSWRKPVSASEEVSFILFYFYKALELCTLPSFIGDVSRVYICLAEEWIMGKSWVSLPMLGRDLLETALCNHGKHCHVWFVNSRVVITSSS